MVEKRTINRVNLSDLNAVVKLLFIQFDDHHIPYGCSEIETTVKAMIQDDRLGFILLADECGESVGLAVVSFAWTVEYAGKTAWLDELYVLPGKRDRGVGKALINQVISHAREAGCKAVDLEVDQGHARAESLYQRAGFTQLPRTRWYKILD